MTWLVLSICLFFEVLLLQMGASNSHGYTLTHGASWPGYMTAHDSAASRGDSGNWRRLVLDAGVEAEAVRQEQLYAPLHLHLKLLQLVHSGFQHGAVGEVVHSHLGLNYVCATGVEQMQGRVRGQRGRRRSLPISDAWLVENAVEGDDDVAMDVAMTLDVVLGDESG